MLSVHGIWIPYYNLRSSIHSPTRLNPGDRVIQIFNAVRFCFQMDITSVIICDSSICTYISHQLWGYLYFNLSQGYWQLINPYWLFLSGTIYSPRLSIVLNPSHRVIKKMGWRSGDHLCGILTTVLVEFYHEAAIHEWFRESFSGIWHLCVHDCPRKYISNVPPSKAQFD